MSAYVVTLLLALAIMTVGLALSAVRIVRPGNAALAAGFATYTLAHIVIQPDVWFAVVGALLACLFGFLTWKEAPR